MSRGNQSEQLEQLCRMLENPEQQSGLYLIDTDLSDEEIETFIKQTCLCRYVKEMLMPPLDKALELFIVGLSHQCKDNSIDFSRNQFIASDVQKNDVAIYDLLIQVIKHVCASEKSVVHIQGELDLVSLRKEDLCKLDAALRHHTEIVLVISKQKSTAMPKDNAIVKFKSLKETVKYRLMENRLDKVHISYKHDDEYEDALNAIKAGLEKNHISYSIDEYDIQYRDNIDEYEKEIGVSDRVIMFVIPKYFESLDCMFEMTQMFKTGNIQSRIYPVVDMKGIPRNGDGLKQVENYWKQEKTKKTQQISDALGSSCDYLTRELAKINAVINTLNDFWEFICRYSTGNFEELIANDAARLMAELQKTLPTVSVNINKEFVPSGDTKPAVFREVMQKGEKTVYVENNMGSITIN